jgi:hypothetical protein
MSEPSRSERLAVIYMTLENGQGGMYMVFLSSLPLELLFLYLCTALSRSINSEEGANMCILG